MKYHTRRRRRIQKKAKFSRGEDPSVMPISTSLPTTDTSDPENVLRLQQTIGNQATIQLMKSQEGETVQREEDNETATESDPIATIQGWVSDLEGNIMPNLERALQEKNYEDASTYFNQALRYPLAIYAGGFKSFAKITFGGLTSLSFDKMQVMAVYQRFFIISKRLNKIAGKYDRFPAFYDVASRYRTMRAKQKQHHQLSKSKSPSPSGGTSRYGNSHPRPSGMGAIRAPVD